MLRCNRCTALWIVAFMTPRQKDKLIEGHDTECPRPEGEPNE